MLPLRFPLSSHLPRHIHHLRSIVGHLSRLHRCRRDTLLLLSEHMTYLLDNRVYLFCHRENACFNLGEMLFKTTHTFFEVCKFVLCRGALLLA